MTYRSKNKFRIYDGLYWLETTTDPAAEPLKTALSYWLNQPPDNKLYADNLFGITQRDYKAFQRDELLTNAALLLTNDGEVTLYKACIELSSKLSSFSTDSLPHIRDGSRECYSDLEILMKVIFDLDITVPCSKDGIYNIVKKQIKY